MASIDIQWPEQQPPEDAISDFRGSLSSVIEKKGYKISDISSRSITYARKFTWPKESFTVTASESDDGSVVSVQGKVRPKLRSSLRELAEMRKTDFELESQGTEREQVLEPVPDPEPEPEPEPELDEPAPEELPPRREPDLDPAARNGHESPLVREVRDSGLLAEGRRRREEAEQDGGEIDCSEMESELQRIYEIAGAPEAFAEALGKVEDLAEELRRQEGCRSDEAIYVAFRRSIAEHRDYLVTRGISRQPVS
jgi:hypothetical protein